MLDTIKRDWKAVLFQSVATALAFVLFLVLASVGLGSIQAAQRQADVADILARTNRAVACELALPVGEDGRDPQAVEFCFVQYNLEPPQLAPPS